MVFSKNCNVPILLLNQFFFAFNEDIIEAFYTCVIMHNIASKQFLSAGDGSNEGDTSYDFVTVTYDDETTEQMPWEKLSLCCIYRWKGIVQASEH